MCRKKKKTFFHIFFAEYFSFYISIRNGNEEAIVNFHIFYLRIRVRKKKILVEIAFGLWPKGIRFIFLWLVCRAYEQTHIHTHTTQGLGRKNMSGFFLTILNNTRWSGLAKMVFWAICPYMHVLLLLLLQFLWSTGAQKPNHHGQKKT